MDGETECEVKSEKDKSPVTVGLGGEGVPAEIVASHHDEENPESKKASDEAAEENSGRELMVDFIDTSEDLEESVVLCEINSTDDDGPPRLNLETPERQTTSPAARQEDQAEDDPANREEDLGHEDHVQPLQLAELFSTKAVDDGKTPVSDQLQQYEKYRKILIELKQQLTADSESAQQQAEELRLKSQEMQDKVESEWRVFMALKQDIAVTALSPSLGKQAALAKVEAVLATEQRLQRERSEQRLKHIKLRMKIQKLEAELGVREEPATDALQLQYEHLQAEARERIKETQMQNEQCLKMQKRISSGLEVLSNIKEKLFWTLMEVQTELEQLAKVEAMVARKRDVLTRTRQARNVLQRDNQRLMEDRGLLGNRVLLRDFEDTADSSEHLEKQLEDLKRRHAAIVSSCGRQLNE